MKSEEDVVYGGNTAKWAKFANSLKLRIAVRLLAQNESKAKQIAADVASASCGYIDALDEDVRFNKGKVRLTGNEGYRLLRLLHGFPHRHTVKFLLPSHWLRKQTAQHRRE